uniref:G-protein coupled receptors family 1 profile domain-containing protein n=1 Tax=Eptatretus burgeri TaxID=7764 RepID=A0A8C4PYU2_EPTBU
MQMNGSILISQPSFIVLDVLTFPRSGPWRMMLLASVGLVPLATCANLMVLCACVLRRFDKPMVLYIALTAVADSLWIMIFMSTVFRTLLVGRRQLSFPECLAQVYVIDLIYVEQAIIFWIMDIDRHWAVFHPFSHVAWASQRHRALIQVGSATAVVAMIIAVYPILAFQLQFCSFEVVIFDALCTLEIMVRTACGRQTAPDIVMLVIASSILTLIAGTLSYSYWRIVSTYGCAAGTLDVKSKALHTCGTQAMVFALKFFTGFALILINRMEEDQGALRFMLTIMMVCVPSCANPLVYGLRTKEIWDPLATVRTSRSSNQPQILPLTC